MTVSRKPGVSIAVLMGGFLLSGCQTIGTAKTAPAVVKAPIQQSQTPGVYRTRSGAVRGHRTTLLKKLSDTYRETPQSIALAANGSIVEVARSGNGTWTILLTNPTGVTCLMAAGTNWETINQSPKGGKS